MHVVSRGVIIRILALLQSKTLIETKNRTLKCLKWHYLTVRSIKKCCIVDGGRAICPLFSSPPRGIWQFMSPHPREFAIQGKKSANPRGSAGGGGRGVAGRGWNWPEKVSRLMHQYRRIGCESKGAFKSHSRPAADHDRTSPVSKMNCAHSKSFLPKNYIRAYYLWFD